MFRWTILVTTMLATSSVFGDVQITGPKSASLGEIVKITADVDCENYRWIVNGPTSGKLEAKTGLAFVPEKTGLVSVVLVGCRDNELFYDRLEILILKSDTRTVIRAPVIKEKLAGIELVMYSSDDCMYCDKFVAEVLPKLSNWKVRVVKGSKRDDGSSVKLYPSFDLRKGNRVVQLSGFKTHSELQGYLDD